MPRISAFYGIAIAMYVNGHAPPHFHARYAEFEATFLIATGQRLEGGVPLRAARLVRAWAALHGAELLGDWNRARQRVPLCPIAPLP